MLVFPAESEKRTLSVLLLASVCPARDQVFVPLDTWAVDQELPLSSETSTNSPLTRLAEVVPEMDITLMMVIFTPLRVAVVAPVLALLH